MFPQFAVPSPIGIHRHKVTVFTLLHGYSRNKTLKGQCEAVKILWGSPAEKTSKQKLAYKVE